MPRFLPSHDGRVERFYLPSGSTLRDRAQQGKIDVDEPARGIDNSRVLISMDSRLVPIQKLFTALFVPLAFAYGDYAKGALLFSMDARYSAYLLTDEWQQRRIGCFMRAGNRCEACSSKDKLQCHHLTYARIFSEPLEDLMALCLPHHEAIELAYKEGLISKTGDPTELRRKTVMMLRPAVSKVAPRVEAIGRPSPAPGAKPEAIREWLKTYPEFIQILDNPPKKFKRLVKLLFKSHPMASKLMSNAYIVFHGTTTKPIVLGPPIHPISPNEKASQMAVELNVLCQKYSCIGRRMIANELYRKIESYIA